MSNLIKRHQIALYLDSTPSGESKTYQRICKTTELTLALNPETEELQFICDEHATTELNDYAPTIEQPLRMYKNDNTFKYVWNNFYNLSVGDDAKTNVLVVFIFDEDSSEAGKYKAWEIADSTLVINELNAVDSSLTFDIDFGGTVTLGTATIVDGVPTFTKA